MLVNDADSVLVNLIKLAYELALQLFVVAQFLGDDAAVLPPVH